MTSDDIRNRAWFDTLSTKLGSTQLTHAVAKIEALERENAALRDDIEWLKRQVKIAAVPQAKAERR